MLTCVRGASGLAPTSLRRGHANRADSESGSARRTVDVPRSLRDFEIASPDRPRCLRRETPQHRTLQTGYAQFASYEHGVAAARETAGLMSSAGRRCRGDAADVVSPPAKNARSPAGPDDDRSPSIGAHPLWGGSRGKPYAIRPTHGREDAPTWSGSFLNNAGDRYSETTVRRGTASPARCFSARNIPIDGSTSRRGYPAPPPKRQRAGMRKRRRLRLFFVASPRRHARLPNGRAVVVSCE